MSPRHEKTPRHSNNPRREKNIRHGPRAALAGAAALVVVAGGAAALTRVTPVMSMLDVPAATASLTDATGSPPSYPAVTPSGTPSATPSATSSGTTPAPSFTTPAATPSATAPSATAPAVTPAFQGSFLAREEAQGNDCLLRVPANPLSARGLATPYQLSNGPNTVGCTMANAANLGAFVQATILEPGGRLAEYDPLVVTAGTRPAIAPPVPVIPRGSVITIDTGFQGNIDFLVGPGARYFDQGLPGSPFGQVAFANGPEFFFLARFEHIQVPALGTSPDDHMTCPTVHDFSLVDQDPSDNVTTEYLVSNGLVAENTAANTAALPGATLVNNGSDNLLIDHFMDPAIGCTGSELQVPSLSAPGTAEATQATDEILADRDQAAPIALVPVSDPMTTVGADDDIIAGDEPNAGNLSITKTNAYREGIGQPLLFGGAVQNAVSFCAGMAGGRTRVANDLMFETASGSPVAGTTLNVFMSNRFNVSLTLLNCALFGGAVLPIPVPGVATPAAVTPSPSPSVTPAVTPSATPTPTPSVSPTDTPPVPTYPAPTDTDTGP